MQARESRSYRTRDPKMATDYLNINISHMIIWSRSRTSATLIRRNALIIHFCCKIRASIVPILPLFSTCGCLPFVKAASKTGLSTIGVHHTAVFNGSRADRTTEPSYRCGVPLCFESLLFHPVIMPICTLTKCESEELLAIRALSRLRSLATMNYSHHELRRSIKYRPLF